MKQQGYEVKVQTDTFNLKVCTSLLADYIRLYTVALSDVCDKSGVFNRSLGRGIRRLSVSSLDSRLLDRLQRHIANNRLTGGR